MAALEIQANQLGVQAAQDCEKMAKDRTMALQMLQKVSSIYQWHYKLTNLSTHSSISQLIRKILFGKKNRLVIFLFFIAV